MKFKFIKKGITIILVRMMGIITPDLKDMLKGFLIKFDETCQATENPYDDLLSELLLEIFGIGE